MVPDESGELEAALGRVVVAYNRLQSDLEALLTELLGGAGQNRAPVTSRLSFRALVAACDEMLGSLDGVPSLEFVGVKQLYQADERRNRLLHSQWVAHHHSPAVAQIFGISSGEAQRGKYSGRDRGFVWTSEQIAELQGFATELDRMGELLSELADEVWRGGHPVE